MFTVYKHTNCVNGKGYVGLTMFTVKERWNAHCYAALQLGSEYAFHRTLRKHGTETWLHEALELHMNLDNARSAEVRLIELHGTYVGNEPRRGYNMTLGGEGSLGLRWTLEQRIRTRGHNSASSKLTLTQVVQMKQAFLTGLTQQELSDLFGIKQSSVSRILHRRTYPDTITDDASEVRIAALLNERVHDKRQFVKDATRLKISIARRGTGNGMFNRRGEASPNFGSKRSEASKQLMREKALAREAAHRAQKPSYG